MRITYARGILLTAETSDGSAIVTNEATSVVNDEEWSTSEKLDSHSLIRLIPSRASDHPSKAVRMDVTPLSSPNASADEHQPVDDSGVREEEKPYGWLKSGSTRSNVSIESTDDESTVDNGGPAANVNLMLVTTDMTALPDGSNSDSVQLDCSAVEYVRFTLKESRGTQITVANQRIDRSPRALPLSSPPLFD